MGGALSGGTVFGWSSPAEIPLTKDEEYGFPIDDNQWSWVGSSVTLGAAVVCAVAGIIIDLIGRKRTMLLLVIPFTLGWGLIIGATSVEMLYVGRVCCGIAGGAFFVIAPMYIGEIAEKDIRGKLGSFFQLMVTIGILIVYLLGIWVNVMVLSIICGCFPLIFGVVFIFMPESPLYLVSKNLTADAIKSLQWLRGSQYECSAEISELQAQHNENVQNKISLVVALKRRATVKGLIIMIGLMIFLQFGGINVVIFYTTQIFEQAKTGLEATHATLMVGAMQVVATFIASMIVDKVGRRIMLMGSIFVMAICLIMLGAYFFMQNEDPDGVTHMAWLPVFALCLYIIVFSLGFGPIPWLMIGELFAADVKGVAGSISGSFSWFLAFVVTKTFTDMIADIGTGPTFWVLGACSLVGTVFVYFVVPETKNKSLAEIQVMLSGDENRSTDTGTTVSVTDVKY